MTLPVGTALVDSVGAGTSARVWRLERGGATWAVKIGHETGHAAALAREAFIAALATSPRLPALGAVGLAEVGEDGRATIVSEAGPRTRPMVAFRWRHGQAITPKKVRAAQREPLALAVARDGAEALADLHDLGLAHGDVKPANLLRHDRDGATACALIDLGLAGPAHRESLDGATPRYLGRGLPRLGDARARDMLAFGLVLAEIASSSVARSDDPLAAAQRARLPSSIRSLTDALLAPSPHARPSARWLARRAGALVGGATGASMRGRKLVRASYLRARRVALGHATRVDADACPWAHEVHDAVVALRAMCRALGETVPESLVDRGSPLGALDPQGRRRWLAALVGTTAASWPLHALGAGDERTWADALARLADALPPPSWTLTAVSDGLAGRPPDGPVARAPSGPLTPARTAELALAVSRLPASSDALEEVETAAADAPDELVSAAAEALRLRGELGRARALVWGRADAGVVRAGILRRTGDVDAAEAAAQEALDRGHDTPRARALLARIALDRGDLAAAATRLPSPRTAAELETAALLAYAQGELPKARALAERGGAVAETAEARARLGATLAYVVRSSDPPTAAEGYAAAVMHAVRAGAVLEEASYRVGEAGSWVDLGALQRAIDTAERAIVLWEDVLARPTMATRAWLALAAAHAAVQAAHETEGAAARCIALAEASGDARAAGYAHWCVADAHSDGSPAGAAAARAAASALGLRLSEGSDDAAPVEDDALHGAARLWRHQAAAIDSARFDREASGTSSGDRYARLVWWGARAARLAGGSSPDAADGHRVVERLLELVDARLPAATRARAMHDGARLAARIGDGEAAGRLEAARVDAASRLRAGTTGPLRTAAEAVPWLATVETRAGAESSAVDLRSLVRALSERTSLQALLERVLDVLLLWTGAERALLLLADDGGALAPKAARNVAREDLSADQLAVSTGLARRAIDRAETVVAIDAMEELGDSHQSVHALKLRSVLAVPLVARGAALGVAYLDDRVRRGAFGKREIACADAVAPVAALAIDDARRRGALERAVAEAQRAEEELGRLLAEKDSALARAEEELARAQSARGTRFDYDSIVGESEAITRLLKMVDRVAVSNVPVLLHGESGSGKELVARAIHRHSERGREPFVGENCGALPEALLESALFGHVRGAFTGADRARVGLFEAADGGTLFLDEIGEMSLGMQTKLLRVTEERRIRPLGSEQSRPVDVRIVAATHRDLAAMVDAGTFREDLYYRLNVITLQVPPLRQRRDDVPLLVRHLLRKHASTPVEVSSAAMAALTAHAWPGNVRQLENEVRRALLLSDGHIDVEHLSIAHDPRDGGAPAGLELRAHVDRLERRLVRRALRETSGNQTRAAKLLGVSRYGLHKMLKRLAIDVAEASGAAH